MKLTKVLLALMLLARVFGPVCAAEVSVITSDDSAPLREALEGFKDTVRHRIVMQYNINIDGDVGRGRQILAEIQKADSNLLFVIGTPALRTVTGKSTGLPIVYSMVPDPSKIIGTKTDNITGVNMNVPVTDVVEVLTSLRPPVRRLGVLTSSLPGERRFADATRRAQARGVRLATASARSPREVSRAVRSLAGKIDALWIVPDPVILTPAVMEYILLWSYENEVPVVGLSKDQTRKGALLSLFPAKAKEMGRQAGELANRILRGGRASKLPPVTTTQTRLTANLKAAGKLGVVIPDRVLARAENAVQAPVYREGDWWVFRVTEQGMAPRRFRVTYVGGRFESSDPIYAQLPPYLQVIHLPSHDRQDLDFPLLAGKKWRLHFRSRGFDTGKLRKPTHTLEAVGWAEERVSTAAGKFEAFELRQNMTSVGDGLSKLFYSPQTKSIVKSFSHFWSHAGDLKVEMELIAYGTAEPAASPRIAERANAKVPNKLATQIDWNNVEVPIYEEGDWWVFRVKLMDRPPQQYRVTYTNGQFQSDHDDFLEVSQNPGSISFLPLISVQAEGPKKKWFDFPLRPGHTWSFRYLHTSGGLGGSGVDGRGYKAWRNVTGSVIGPRTRLINTRAGKFKTIEIRRSVDTGGGAFEFTYFYSPETNSTVKVLASGFVANNTSHIDYGYEMELVAYGRGAFRPARLRTTRSAPVRTGQTRGSSPGQ